MNRVLRPRRDPRPRLGRAHHAQLLGRVRTQRDGAPALRVRKDRAKRPNQSENNVNEWFQHVQASAAPSAGLFSRSTVRRSLAAGTSV